MLVKTVLNANDLQKEFEKMGRDYFSLDGYQALIDLFDEFENPQELDVIAICCEFEEEKIDYIMDSYSNLFKKENYVDDEGVIDRDKFIEDLNYYTWAQDLGDTIIYQNF